MWSLRYGDRGWEIEARAARKLPPPQWAIEQPELEEHLVWFWEAYWELDSCRTWAETNPLRIPWSRIKEFAEHYEVDFEYLLKVVKNLDACYLNYVNEKRTEEMKQLRSKSSKHK